MSRQSALLKLEILEDRTMLSGTTVSSAPTVPVLIVPGFLASLPYLYDIRTFITQRGIAPTDFYFAPGVYDSLVSTLEHSGYVLGKTLFEATYDWRESAAPVDGTFDGTINGLEAHWSQPNNYLYAVDYLRYWLTQAELATGSPVVDIISHSTGGVITRAYIQSDAYGMQHVFAGDDKAGNPIYVNLPKVRNFIMGAAPTEGSALSWNVWNGDFTHQIDSNGAQTIRIAGVLLFAEYEYVAFAHCTISGPDYDITYASIQNSNELQQEINFYRLWCRLQQDLMPTYDFLDPVGSLTPGNVNGQPTLRSNTLLDLNADCTPGSNPWDTLLTGKLTVTYSVDAFAVNDQGQLTPGLLAQTVNEISTNVGIGGQIYQLNSLLRKYPIPTPTVIGQTWYTMISNSRAGDTVVPLQSLQATFFAADGDADPSLTVQQWGNQAPPVGLTPQQTWTQVSGDITHADMFNNPLIAQWTVQTLLEEGGNSNPVAAVSPRILKALTPIRFTSLCFHLPSCPRSPNLYRRLKFNSLAQTCFP